MSHCITLYNFSNAKRYKRSAAILTCTLRMQIPLPWSIGGRGHELPAQRLSLEFATLHSYLHLASGGGMASCAVMAAYVKANKPCVLWVSPSWALPSAQCALHAGPARLACSPVFTNH